MFDFLDSTTRRLAQITEYGWYASALNDESVEDTLQMAIEVATQASGTANEILQALGGVGITLDDAQKLQIHAISQLIPPEGPTTWFITSPEGQRGELALEINDAKAQLQE